MTTLIKQSMIENLGESFDKKIDHTMTGELVGIRNFVVNGSFDVHQPALEDVVIGAGASGYVTDMVKVSTTAGMTCTFRRVRSTSWAYGPNHGFFEFGGSGLIGSSVTFFVESARTLANRPATLTFYAANNMTSNLQVIVRQHFGTGGSPSNSVDIVIDLNDVANSLSETGQRKIPFFMPTVGGRTFGTNGDDHIEIIFIPQVGIANNLVLGRVGLVAGDASFTSDPIGRRTFPQELALAQRYFCKTFDHDVVPIRNSGNTNGAIWATGQVANVRFGTNWRFPVSMRAIPLVTTFSPNAATANWRTNTTTPTAVVTGGGTQGVYIAGTTSVTAGADYSIHATADARY